MDKSHANELMRAGLAAFARGEKHQAHYLWRQSAALQPDNEQIWLALLSVVKTDEDRRACLNNVIRINPHNQQAIQQLDYLDTFDLNLEPLALPPIPPDTFSRRLARAFRRMLRLVFILITLVLLTLSVIILLVQFGLL